MGQEIKEALCRSSNRISSQETFKLISTKRDIGSDVTIKAATRKTIIT